MSAYGRKQTLVNSQYERLVVGNLMRHVTLTLSLVFLPVAGSAHHSILGIYSRGSVSEIEGELTNVSWRNPHVLFSVISDDGEIWEIESAPPTELERYGITRELLEEGKRYRVAGEPSRRNDNAIFATNILLPDGLELLTYPRSTARWSNRTLQRGRDRVISESAALAAEESANGVFRVWAGSLNIEWDAKLTDTALAARDQWNPSRDPRLRCIPPGMVDVMVSSFPIELIEEGRDIVIRIEQFDRIRRIHMGDSGDAEDAPPTPMGYSVGHWDGDTLVVSTNRVSWPYFDDLGTPQSEEVEMVERFSMSDDEQRLRWEATITDPTYLAEPAVVRQQYEWIPGEEIKPYNCAAPDEAG